MFVLITGTLHRDPVSRTGKTGAPFVTAQMRWRSGQETAWASVIAFAEDARAELLRLHEDDVLTVQGEARLSTYTAKRWRRAAIARNNCNATCSHCASQDQRRRRE